MNMDEDAGDKDREREQNGRDAQRMADPVHGMQVAGGVLRDPLLVGAVAQHMLRMIHLLSLYRVFSNLP